MVIVQSEQVYYIRDLTLTLCAMSELCGLDYFLIHMGVLVISVTESLADLCCNVTLIFSVGCIDVYHDNGLGNRHVL